MKDNKNNSRKKRKLKGFTLVEVIVVMVILAILAALLLPSLTGYIDKANKQGVIVEARSVLTAMQTTASEKYGKDSDFRGKSAADKAKALADDADAILELAELTDKGEISDIECTKQAKITKFTWDNDAYSVTYENGGFSEPTESGN